MGTRARGRLLAAVAVLAAAAGCGPGQPDPPVPAVPAFATTEARVVVTDDRTFPVNLLFLADEDDPIWTDVSAVVLSPDLEVSGFTVEAGDVTDRGRLGNLTLGVVPPATAVTATDVIVVLGDGTSRAYPIDRKSTRLNSSHVAISYAVFCLKKKKHGMNHILIT